MGIVNGAVLAETQLGFRTVFDQAFNITQVEYEQIVMMVPSSNRSERYKWLGAIPKMQALRADVPFEKLSAYQWEVINSTYVNGIEVDREDIEDDALNLILPTVAEMGAEARRHPGELVWNLLNNGFTGLGYDGQAFFATT